MTEKELNNLYHIKKRIEKLKERIAELDAEFGIGSSAISGMPHGTGVSSPIEALVMKKTALEDDLNREITKKLDEERTIRSYISSIDDEEIKRIMELRFISLMKWCDIGAELGVDRTTPQKKIKNFLKNH